MKNTLFHIMMICRKPVLIILKICMIVLFLGGIFTFAGIFMSKNNTFNLAILSVVYMGTGFGAYFLSYHYDKILLKMNPDETTLILYK